MEFSDGEDVLRDEEEIVVYEAFRGCKHIVSK